MKVLSLCSGYGMVPVQGALGIYRAITNPIND